MVKNIIASYGSTIYSNQNLNMLRKNSNVTCLK